MQGTTGAVKRGSKQSKSKRAQVSEESEDSREAHLERNSLTAVRKRREVRQPQNMSLPGQAGGGGKEDWEAFTNRTRQANLKLGTMVSEYDQCVNIQGTSEEDVEARIQHARKREQIRRDCVGIQEDLMSHMSDGTLEDKRSEFFTECYNYTNSVDRFMKGLEKSLGKERRRLEANRAELEKIQKSSMLSDNERADAISQCNGVEEITKEKEKTILKIKDEMSNLIQQLRYQASADVAAAKTAEDGYDDDPKGAAAQLLLSDNFRRKAPYAFIAFLFLIAIVLGSVKWYVWWTAA